MLFLCNLNTITYCFIYCRCEDYLRILGPPQINTYTIIVRSPVSVNCWEQLPAFSSSLCFALPAFSTPLPLFSTYVNVTFVFHYLRFPLIQMLPSYYLPAFSGPLPPFSITCVLMNPYAA